MEGSGRMLVTAVGENSQAGIIYSLLNNMHGELPSAIVNSPEEDDKESKAENVNETENSTGESSIKRNTTTLRNRSYLIMILI